MGILQAHMGAIGWKGLNATCDSAHLEDMQLSD